MLKVSVIIPVYNVEAYLQQCLDSVVNQTLREIEIICVNDGSTDESAAILNEYVSKDARIKILTQVNSGQGAARNSGLTVANGEYVYFMDADDELASCDALDVLVRELECNRLDILLFDAEISYNENIKNNNAFNSNMYIRRHDYSSINTGRNLFALQSSNDEYSPSPCIVIYRRSFLKENNIQFPSERIFYEDNIFMTRVLLAAQRASHRPWRFYLRKVHAGSTVTSKPTIRHLRGYLACYRDVCEILASGAWDMSTRKALFERRVVYKLNVRRMVDAYPDLRLEAKRAMSPKEYDVLCSVLFYPLSEKIVNAIRCWREHGFRYTIRRIFLGRQR